LKEFAAVHGKTPTRTGMEKASRMARRVSRRDAGARRGEEAGIGWMVGDGVFGDVGATLSLALSLKKG
jgi:hypothetical protein